ncbi:MAG TPA: T9SS type A sorting domain-containing protein [Bacteroidia bacterium]|nr:T9SS type A sorting domain-containing protein [Bacteroidia bacterium]
MKKILRTQLFFIMLLPVTLMAQWSNPVNISPNAMNASMNENMGPCMASSHDTLHVIWSDHRTHGYAIYYIRSIDSGNTWSTAVAITDTMGYASMPSLAVNGRNIHVVWWDTLLGIACSYYEHSLDGGNTWGGKLCIDSNTDYWPGVAVSGATVLISIDKKPALRTTVFMTKSINNGNSFGAEQQISTPISGTGRSEDQGMATDGKYIHMCWNDNRDHPLNPRVLETYYRRSKDMGATWETEVDLTDTTSYSPMVFLDSAHVDVAFGFGNIGNAWLSQSDDSGNIRGSNFRVTTNSNPNESEAYPFLVHDGLNIYMVSHIFPTIPWGEWYTQSSDGGITWSPQILLGSCSGTAFITLTCPLLNVVWPDNGIIYYTRNPTGGLSCSTTTGIANTKHNDTGISVFPNPASTTAIINFGEGGIHTIELYDVTGRKLSRSTCTETEFKFSCSELSAGIYFIKVTHNNSNSIIKFLKQ